MVGGSMLWHRGPLALHPPRLHPPCMHLWGAHTRVGLQADSPGWDMTATAMHCCPLKESVVAWLGLAAGGA